jgi:phosphate/sulfate permease
MTIGSSIFVIAVGAILRYAINDEIESINLETIGLILMIAGAVGLVLGLFLYSQDRRRDDVVVQRRDDLPPR